MGTDHPLAWGQRIDDGGSWYTAMDHAALSDAGPLCRMHLVGIESMTKNSDGCGG